VTAPTRHDELRALRRPFAIGIALIVLAVVALGVVIARFGSNADRPAGIAERWLVAVGDTTRDGVEDDARERIEELSVDADGVASADVLIRESGPAADEGERAFESVRVGPPLEEGDDTAVVPAAITPRDGDEAQLYLAMARVEGSWRVVGPQGTGPEGAIACPIDEDCPGFPIERPERAPIGWFVGALALGALITVGCVAAVRAATPKPT
jgi:hypothetical protein